MKLEFLGGFSFDLTTASEPAYVDVSRPSISLHLCRVTSRGSLGTENHFIERELLPARLRLQAATPARVSLPRRVLDGCSPGRHLRLSIAPSGGEAQDKRTLAGVEPFACICRIRLEMQPIRPEGQDLENQQVERALQ
jgi:hypothetical protein